MKPTILYFNYREEDPTKRLKLAGVRRYAAAGTSHRASAPT